jgi:hypothetical protein
MAGNTFDSFAKALATGASRRSVLKAFGLGVLGTLAGAMLGPRSGEAAEKKCTSATAFDCDPTRQNQPTKTTCTGSEKTSGGPACTCFRCSPLSIISCPEGFRCGSRDCFCDQLPKCPGGTDAECVAGGCPTCFCAVDTCCGGSTPGNVCVPPCGEQCPARSTNGGLTPVGPLPLP